VGQSRAEGGHRSALVNATSSPGCVNFTLKTKADQYEETCNNAVPDFIQRNFYVDDGLKSVRSVKVAKELIKNTKSLCHKGGLRLHKFTSNSREVISSVREEDRAVDAKDHHTSITVCRHYSSPINTIKLKFLDKAIAIYNVFLAF